LPITSIDNRGEIGQNLQADAVIIAWRNSAPCTLWLKAGNPAAEFRDALISARDL
jgi:hypothetical protein